MIVSVFQVVKTTMFKGSEEGYKAEAKVSVRDLDKPLKGDEVQLGNGPFSMGCGSVLRMGTFKIALHSV